MNSLREPKPNWSLSQLLESKGTFFNFKVVFVSLNDLLLSSRLSSMLQDIEKGNHDDEKCEEYCRNYKKDFGHELPDCQFKGNKSKIQNLLKIQIVKENSQGTKSLLTKMKNLFRRK